MRTLKVLVASEESDLMPSYATASSAGADVHAAIKENLVIEPGSSALISTGLKIEIPEGYEIQVRPRSGLALKNQITVLNSPGTIDSDYRGDIGVILINHGQKPFVVTPKMRIAQIVLSPISRAEFVLKAKLAVTSRGEGGFGHSGL